MIGLFYNIPDLQLLISALYFYDIAAETLRIFLCLPG